MIKRYDPNTGEYVIDDTEQGINHYLEDEDYYEEFQLGHVTDFSEDTLDRLEAIRYLEEIEDIGDEDGDDSFEFKRGKGYDLKPGFLKGADRRVVSVAGRPKTVKSTTQASPWRHPGQMQKVYITSKRQSGVVAGKKISDDNTSGKSLQKAAIIENLLSKKDKLF